MHDEINQPLIDRLVSLGASVAAARAVFREGKRLARLTRRPTGIEYGQTIDIASGKLLGPDLRGEWSDRNKNSISFRPHLRLIEQHGGKHRYVQVHSHPQSTAPSDLDVAILVAHHALQAMVVAGVNGTWYLVAKDSREPPPVDYDSGDRAGALFRRTFLELLPLVDEAIEAGRVTTHEDALRLHTHLTWERIAGPLNLQYHRFGAEKTDEQATP